MCQSVEMAAALLAHGANVNHVAASGETPLWIAAQQGHAKLVELLLEHGADPTIPATITAARPVVVFPSEAAYANGHFKVGRRLAKAVREENVEIALDVGTDKIDQRDRYRSASPRPLSPLPPPARAGRGPRAHGSARAQRCSRLCALTALFTFAFAGYMH